VVSLASPFYLGRIYELVKVRSVTGLERVLEAK
jgi:hypothetical protein